MYSATETRSVESQHISHNILIQNRFGLISSVSISQTMHQRADFFLLFQTLNGCLAVYENFPYNLM